MKWQRKQLSWENQSLKMFFLELENMLGIKTGDFDSLVMICKEAEEPAEPVATVENCLCFAGERTRTRRSWINHQSKFKKRLEYRSKTNNPAY
jgi:hypothetical protein